MPVVEKVRETLGSLYDDQTRPEMIKGALVKLGAPTVLAKVGLVNGSADDLLMGTAKMTTIAGLMEKKGEFVEVVTPYIVKARAGPEGRKEIVDEIAATSVVVGTKAYVDEKVLKPVDAKWNAGKELVDAKVTAGKEFAAPYVATVKEKAAPYTQKLEEIRRSERVEAMITAFQDARAHPKEKVGELRDKAVDLIKYENLKAYRDHVMSEQFRQDTLQLVTNDLPAMAKSAAARGADSVKTGANNLAAQVAEYKEKTKAMAGSAVEMGKEKAVETKEELEILRQKLKETTLALISELQAEVKDGVQHVKAEGFSLGDTMDRLKRVVGVVDKIVVSPIIKKVTSKASSIDTLDVTDPAPVKTGADVEDRPIVNGTHTAGSVTDEDEFKDSEEHAEVTP